MDSRRAFLKKASLLAGGAGLWSTLPASIQKAMAINPAVGSTYLDAEHVVFLMQENRSFDHTFGSLQGVRGFNDPRAISLPNKNKVWLQTNPEGETYAPFRLDIKNTKATWMSSLPHSWGNQVDARNNGHFDKWLHAKQPWQKEYKSLPMTLGFYTREDIPFYYALADAFTVCDQNFCSSLTGTTPNRLFFWTGTIRSEKNENSMAHVWNEDTDYDKWGQWKTYPERLEENGVSWKVYQNDISVDGGYSGEQDEWMSNFTDNPLEFFKQYNVKLSERYINYLQNAQVILPKQIGELEDRIHSFTAADEQTATVKKDLEEKKATLEKVKKEAAIYTKEKYDQLSQQQKNIHEKAFTSNKKDPDFYKLTSLQYNDDGTQREVNIPKGDVLYQFREDVNTGKLPTVSWLVAPETFSDHPSSAWYGAWYLSEVLDILTKNPEVWKKTIFVLTYDENDGYFDHVPPFTSPNTKNPETGKTSAGIDASTDFVTMEQERRREGAQEQYLRESSIGLGYRVPMVIASPWSRGGWVNSQVFDHTSSLQFLEVFLEKKTGKKIEETNITRWRRAVCGDLTSAFRQYNGDKINDLKFVEKDPFIESIHQAKFKDIPKDYKQFSADEMAVLNKQPHQSEHMPKQEKGTREACALPYELHVDGNISADKKSFEIKFEAGNKLFGKKAAGAPFTVYAINDYKQQPLKEFAYATEAGDNINDSWKIADFDGGNYHLRVYGPNGFYREFIGDKNDPDIKISATYKQDKIALEFAGNGNAAQTIQVTDNAYKNAAQTIVLPAGTSANASLLVNTVKSFGWYDFSITINGIKSFTKRYAGRIETGKPSHTDPVMGMVQI